MDEKLQLTKRTQNEFRKTFFREFLQKVKYNIQVRLKIRTERYRGTSGTMYAHGSHRVYCLAGNTFPLTAQLVWLTKTANLQFL